MTDKYTLKVDKKIAPFKMSKSYAHEMKKYLLEITDTIGMKQPKIEIIKAKKLKNVI